MKVEKISANSYRIRKMHNGKSVSLYFDHIPNDIEIAEQLVKKTGRVSGAKKVFSACAMEYISSKSNILSPSTIRSYDTILRGLSDEFKALDIYKIEKPDIQTEINRIAAIRSPKTARNYNAFIISIIDYFRDIKFKITLPQKQNYKGHTPTDDEVDKVISAVRGTEYEIPFGLAVFGFRRSEICAITLDDIKGNKITINKAMVKNTHNKWVIKPYPKTPDSVRTVGVAPELTDAIREKGYVFKYTPNTLNNKLHRVQKELNIPEFRFHDMRHYFVTYCHALGYPDAYIQYLGGWKSNHVMNRVYRDTMEKKVAEIEEDLARKLLGNALTNTDKM